MWTPRLWGAVGSLLLSSCHCLGHASQPGSRHVERGTWSKTRSIICSIADVFTATAPSNSNMTMETAQFFPNYNSKRVKISYGPFTVPPMSVNNGMEDWTVSVARKPCTGCLVTWIQAGLEYPNGTVANADTGLWLHHTVFYNTQRTAIVCPQAGAGDSFFASGNERTAVDICVNG
jgi:hypothetical protein